MKSRNKARLALALMAVSLVALACFEVIWLQNEYKREIHHLQIQQNEFLHSAVRGLEDSLLEVLVIAPLDVDSDSVELTSPHGGKVLFHRHDTAKVMTIVRGMPGQHGKERKHSEPNADYDPRKQMKVRFEARRSLMLGMLSRQLATGEHDIDTSAIGEMISAKLSGNTDHSPPLDYTLVKYKDNEATLSLAGLLSTPYYDLWTNNHYAVLYPRYRGYVFRQIIPQLLFCLFLFGCIAGAFYLVYRNFLRERKLAEFRRDFISNITHELKTPISTVRVALEALTNFNAVDDHDKREEYLAISRGELDRLSLLVDKVLQLSQFDQHQVRFHFETTDLNQVIEQTLATMKVQFRQKHADVRFNSRGENFNVLADRLHMTGLVYNLLDNALKYSPEAPVVDVSLVQQNGSVKLEVEDHGVGIAREHLDSLFDKFFRVPKGDEHNVKGHGLGLSYVANVVEAHRGTIEVDSQPGRGTRFTVTLPRTNGDQDPVR